MNLLQDISLYFRLIMYPLAILALIIIATIKTQNGATRVWKVSIFATMLVVSSLFIIEMLLVIQPSLHELIKTIILTPSITLLAIVSWIYVFRCSFHKPKHFNNEVR